MIASLSVEIKMSLYGSPEGVETQSYSMDRPPVDFIPCPNCGSRLAYRPVAAISEMVAKRATSAQPNAVCEGEEKIGRGLTRKCMMFFAVSITITYKEGS